MKQSESKDVATLLHSLLSQITRARTWLIAVLSVGIVARCRIHSACPSATVGHPPSEPGNALWDIPKMGSLCVPPNAIILTAQKGCQQIGAIPTSGVDLVLKDVDSSLVYVTGYAWQELSVLEASV